MNITKSICFGISLLLGGLACADTVTVPNQNSNKIWQTWNASVTPFWDNSSWDGNNKNIGDCLSSTANCGIKNAPGMLPYLGNSKGQAFSDFYFNNTNGQSGGTMQIQIAGDRASETFGWYNINNPKQFQVLFSGITSQNTTIDFTPSAQYGFFFTNADANQSYLTQSSLQGSDIGVQHFSVFEQGTGTYYLGIEDLPKGHSDMDYNDMIVKVSPTPEPGSMVLLGSGLLGMGVLGFKRRKALSEIK